TLWALRAMAVAQVALTSTSGIVAGLYYVVAGLGWVLPAMPLGALDVAAGPRQLTRLPVRRCATAHGACILACRRDPPEARDGYRPPTSSASCRSRRNLSRRGDAAKAFPDGGHGAGRAALRRNAAATTCR